MKALSVKQPWAWAIFHGKPVENRKWKTEYRGPLLIHASQSFDFEGMFWISQNFEASFPPEFPRGSIIGRVVMEDCVTIYKSPWFFGPYGFVLTDRVEFEEPIPYPGSPKFFEVPDFLIENLQLKIEN